MQDVTKLHNLKPASSYTSSSLQEPVLLRLGKEGFDDMPPQTIPQLFRESCKRYTHLPALAFETDLSEDADKEKTDWNIITYGDYERKVEHTALLLMHVGLQPHSTVCVLANNCPEWFYVELGAILAGGVLSGIYPTSSSEAVCHALKTSEATVCVVDDSTQLAKVREVKSQLPKLKAIIQLSGPYDDFMDVEQGYYRWTDLKMMQFEEAMREELKRRERNIGANECAILYFTSGTTGMPKAVMISHDCFVVNTKSLNSFVGCLERANEVTVSYLPLCHMAGQLYELFCSLENGDCVYFADRNALKGTLTKTLEKVRPTRLCGVPRVYEKMQERMSLLEMSYASLGRYIMNWAREIMLYYQMSSLKASKITTLKYYLASNIVYKLRAVLGLERCKSLIAGSAPMTLETKQFFMGLGITLHNLYGITEGGGAVTCTKDATNLNSAGELLQYYELRIEHPDNEGYGEVCVRSRCVMMGYLNEPKKTAEVIDPEGWLHTGDLGHMTKDGHLIINGRLKELIITSGGENVPPVRIEDLVKRELPCISNAVLIGDKRKYLTILLSLKTEFDSQTGMPLDILLPDAVSWFQDLGCNFKRLSEVLKVRANLTEIEAANIVVKPEFCVLEAIQEALDRVNAKAISRAQKVQKFTLLPHDLSMPTGELGPTLKLRRSIIIQKYAKIIERMY